MPIRLWILFFTKFRNIFFLTILLASKSSPEGPIWTAEDHPTSILNKYVCIICTQQYFGSWSARMDADQDPWGTKSRNKRASVCGSRQIKLRTCQQRTRSLVLSIPCRKNPAYASGYFKSLLVSDTPNIQVLTVRKPNNYLTRFLKHTNQLLFEFCIFPASLNNASLYPVTFLCSRYLRSSRRYSVSFVSISASHLQFLAQVSRTVRVRWTTW